VRGRVDVPGMRHETGYLAAPMTCRHALSRPEHPDDCANGLPTFMGAQVRLADRYQQFPAPWAPGLPASTERQASGRSRLAAKTAGGPATLR
jgi:hypothetical protein